MCGTGLPQQAARGCRAVSREHLARVTTTIAWMLVRRRQLPKYRGAADQKDVPSRRDHRYNPEMSLLCEAPHAATPERSVYRSGTRMAVAPALCRTPTKPETLHPQ